jgi:hypothetical protein
MVSSLKSAAYKKINPEIKQDTIVKGNFPVYEDFRNLAIFKFNRLLSFSLAGCILVTMVSYSMVVAKENQIAQVHSKTNEINFENIDLQNKVDYVKSFYNVNDKIAKISFLKKADKIIEVEAASASLKKNNNDLKIDVRPVPGF